MKLDQHNRAGFLVNAKIVSVAVILVLLVFSPIRTSIFMAVESPHNPYWFISFNDNKIEHSPSLGISSNFASIVRDATQGREPLTILHIGDSHIQADFFTGETRRLLSNWLGDSNTSRGFTFPYSIAGSNNPDDIKVTWQGQWIRNRANGDQNRTDLGVSGMSLTTYDKSSSFSITLNHRWVSFKSFDLVKIYFDNAGTGVVPQLNQSAELVNASFDYVTYKLAGKTDSLNVGLTWSNAENESFTLYGVELLNSNAKLVYHAAGVNGASVNTFLQSDNFSKQLAQINPKLVIVSLGTNDAYNDGFIAANFSRGLRELVHRIKVALPHTNIIITTPGDHLIGKERENPNIKIVQTQIINVAQETGCGVWDFYRVMGKEGSIGLWSYKGLCAPDMLHLNRNGYKLQGALLFSALVKLAGDQPALAYYADE